MSQGISDPERKKSFRRSWRSSGPVARVTAVCTGIIAVATVLYMLFAGWQLYEIRSGGEETRKLAQAASDQAKAMEGQLRAMQDQGGTMREQTGTLKDSLTETQKLVEQNERAVKATETQANASMSQAETSRIAASAAQKSAQIALLTELPRLTANRVDITIKAKERITIQVIIHNSGNSPAYRTNIGGAMATGDPPVPNLLLIPPVGRFSESDIGAGESIVFSLVSPVPISEQEFEEIVSGKKFLYAVGTGIFYDGFRGCHPVQFCFFYNPKVRTLSTCPASIQYEQQENQLRCPKQ